MLLVELMNIVYSEKEPFQNGLYNFIKHDLDIQLMNECCKELVKYKILLLW